VYMSNQDNLYHKKRYIANTVNKVRISRDTGEDQNLPIVNSIYVTRWNIRIKLNINQLVRTYHGDDKSFLDALHYSIAHQPDCVDTFTTAIETIFNSNPATNRQECGHDKIEVQPKSVEQQLCCSSGVFFRKLVSREQWDEIQRSDLAPCGSMQFQTGDEIVTQCILEDGDANVSSSCNGQFCIRLTIEQTSHDAHALYSCDSTVLTG